MTRGGGGSKISDFAVTSYLNGPLCVLKISYELSFLTGDIMMTPYIISYNISKTEAIAKFSFDILFENRTWRFSINSGVFTKRESPGLFLVKQGHHGKLSVTSQH